MKAAHSARLNGDEGGNSDLTSTRSDKMRDVLHKLTKLASTEFAIILEGESGTGKEVSARWIHARSRRADGPFAVVDCAAMVPALLSAELFGHERGAFTGATVARPGMFELAHGGTLFLDEIGELPLDSQAALLGALDRRCGRRVGGAQEIAYDVRVVAATNRNLRHEVHRRRFRQDLYFRLGSPIHLPPLRERREDIAPLADGFASQFEIELSPKIRAMLVRLYWPGNIRELRHVIEHIAISPDDAEDIIASRARSGAPAFAADGRARSLTEARRIALDHFEEEYVRQLLEHVHGNISRAAVLARVTRRTMQRLGAKHALRPSDEEDGN
jgi:DNA-binding NtrC family response regulator